MIISKGPQYVLGYSYDDEGDDHTRSFEDDDDDKDLPFFYKIRITPNPKDFIRPKLEKYTMQSDPMYHLEDYKTEIKLKNASDSLKCMTFYMTLTRAAKKWYLKLKPGSFWSWLQLIKKALMSAFVGHNLGKAPTMQLNNIRQ
ncbi:Retrotrans gag domain-containing protein [Abeliophyllum distichum]|uniref:Retrotrans gag domain-containing protein n=1 Tax=Abeliophyllum distichum TaxID=126358 RepID=A0ABD1UNF1_9LAMI